MKVQLSPILLPIVPTRDIYHISSLLLPYSCWQSSFGNNYCLLEEPAIYATINSGKSNAGVNLSVLFRFMWNP